MTKHVVACARAVLAGLPSLAQGGDRIRSLGGPAALARAPATPQRVARASAPLRLVRRAPAGRVPERVTKFRRNERGDPTCQPLAARHAGVRR